MVYIFLPSLLMCTLEGVDSLAVGLVVGISGSLVLGSVLIMGSWYGLYSGSRGWIFSTPNSSS